MNKAGVLRKAIEVIHKLQNENARLKQENIALKMQQQKRGTGLVLVCVCVCVCVGVWEGGMGGGNGGCLTSSSCTLLIPVPALFLLVPASLRLFNCKILCNVA